MSITGKLAREFDHSTEVIDLDQAFFPNPWTTEQWLSTPLDQHLLFTWRTSERVIGYALLQAISSDDLAHLLKILLIPDCRGQGEAKTFWNKILEELTGLGLKNIYLEVEASNASAIRFYEKCGLQLLRRNKAYYSNGEDALIMSMTLEDKRV